MSTAITAAITSAIKDAAVHLKGKKLSASAEAAIPPPAENTASQEVEDKRPKFDFVGRILAILKKKKKATDDQVASKQEPNPLLSALRDQELTSKAAWEAAKKERLNAIHEEWAKEKARRRAERGWREATKVPKPRKKKRSNTKSSNKKSENAAKAAKANEGDNKAKRAKTANIRKVAEREKLAREGMAPGKEKVAKKEKAAKEEKSSKEEKTAKEEKKAAEKENAAKEEDVALSEEANESTENLKEPASPAEDNDKEAADDKSAAGGDEKKEQEEDFTLAKEVTEQHRQIGDNDRTFLDGMQRASVVEAWKNGDPGSSRRGEPTQQPKTAIKHASKPTDLPVPEDRTEMHRGIGNMERTWVEGMQEIPLAQKWIASEEKAKDPSLTIDPYSEQNRQLGDMNRTVLEGMVLSGELRRLEKERKKKDKSKN